MAEIRFLKRSEIDDERWNECVAGSGFPAVYGQTWYLDAITGNQWSALVYGRYQAVFPLPYRRKYGFWVLYQPFFCQQLGLFALPGVPVRYVDFLKKIPLRFIKTHLHLNESVALPDGIKKRTNYMLNLKRDYHILEAAYNKDARKNLKKCNEAGMQVTETQNPEAVIHLYREIWGSLNPHVTAEHYKLFLNACHSAMLHNSLLVLEARIEEKVQGAAIFLRSAKMLHYVCAAPAESGRKWGVMHAIIDEVIKKYAGSEMILDFEGSEIKAVADFYCKFSPEHHAYGVYSRFLGQF